jgi:hypothetical protein
MAIDPYLREGAFMPEATAGMGEAFEAVCNEFHLADESDELRALVATRIIAAARQGEIDPIRLRMKAVAGFFIAIPPRRIYRTIDHWPQDRPVKRLNWPRVAFAGLLVAATVTIPVILRFQATSERTLQAASGVPSAATEGSSTPKAHSSPPLQPDGTLVERRSVRPAMNDPELASENSLKARLLLSKAEGLLAVGDISAARLVLQRVALTGNAQAALLLGGTYEGCLLPYSLCNNTDADRAAARYWYEMAAKFGSAEARQRLDRLADKKLAGDLPTHR